MDFSQLLTPCYIIDEEKLRKNGEILQRIQNDTGCRVLLAQKCFSCYDFYPLLSEYLAGTEASGLYEARLGAEKMPGKECHVFCTAFSEDEFDELLHYADHIIFNSITQLSRFGPAAKKAGKSVGLRINPECSTQTGHSQYDPCAPGSRLGVTREEWTSDSAHELLPIIDGLHFHTLCEQGSDALAVTLDAVEEKFGIILRNVKWLNCGGGHHITRPGYDVETLESCIRRISGKYSLQVYLEPGEAVALNAGELAATVLDIKRDSVILDASAACHMPDVLEMPYRPPLRGSGKPDELNYTYRLCGQTCLAGDIIGTYSFDHPLRIGEKLLFEDMAIYTMVKNNTFNGMPLPSIVRRCENGEYEILRRFGYENFVSRLGS